MVFRKNSRLKSRKINFCPGSTTRVIQEEISLTSGTSSKVVGIGSYSIPQGAILLEASLIVIAPFADAAGAITITNGNGGDTLIAQSFPTGLHTLNIPDNGILAENGAYLSAFSGSSNKLTIFLS